MVVFAQRPDAVTRTGVLQPIVSHDFAQQAHLVASEWAPITVGEYEPKDVAKAADAVAELFGQGQAAALETDVGPVELSYDVPPDPGQRLLYPLWQAARRATDGLGSMLVNDRGRRTDVHPIRRCPPGTHYQHRPYDRPGTGRCAPGHG